MNTLRLTTAAACVIALGLAGCGGDDKPKPVKPTKTPASVKNAVAKTEAAPRLVVETKGQGLNSRLIFDNKRKLAASYDRGQLKVLSTADAFYTRAPQGCFSAADNAGAAPGATAAPAATAQQPLEPGTRNVFPIGSYGVTYDTERDGSQIKVAWELEIGGDPATGKKRTSKGASIVDAKTGRLLSSNVGTLKVTFSYPATVDISVPTNLCRS